MSTLHQGRAVIELGQKGWEAVRLFPNPTSVAEVTVGGPIYLTNTQRQMIVVDSTGTAYPVDLSLETATKNPPAFSPSP